MLGISISSFAHPLVVLDQTDSPAKAGLVGSILAGTAFLLRLPARAPLGGARRQSETHPLADVFTGLRWIRAQRFLRTLLLWFVGMGVVFNSLGLVVLVLARDRGASAGQLGVAFAITAAGGVIGALGTPYLLRSVRPSARPSGRSSRACSSARWGRRARSWSTGTR